MKRSSFFSSVDRCEIVIRCGGAELRNRNRQAHLRATCTCTGPKHYVGHLSCLYAKQLSHIFACIAHSAVQHRMCDGILICSNSHGKVFTACGCASAAAGHAGTQPSQEGCFPTQSALIFALSPSTIAMRRFRTDK